MCQECIHLSSRNLTSFHESKIPRRVIVSSRKTQPARARDLVKFNINYHPRSIISSTNKWRFHEESKNTYVRTCVQICIIIVSPSCKKLDDRETLSRKPVRDFRTVQLNLARFSRSPVAFAEAIKINN